MTTSSKRYSLTAPFVAIGAFLVRGTDDLGGIARLAFASALQVLSLRIDRAETIRQLDRLGLSALPLILAGSAIVGGVVAMQGLGYVSRYNATEVYGWAAGLSAYREVGPLLLGLTLAARVGTKNAAELASMTANERIDALIALGLDDKRVVLAPRIVAIVAFAFIVFPLCTTTIVGVAFLLAALLGDQLVVVSFYSLVEYLPATHVLEGLARMIAFGALTAVVSTYFGRNSGRQAKSIGAAVYSSSVAAMTAIVILNLYLSLLSGAA